LLLVAIITALRNMIKLGDTSGNHLACH